MAGRLGTCPGTLQTLPQHGSITNADNARSNCQTPLRPIQPSEGSVLAVPTNMHAVGLAQRPAEACGAKTMSTTPSPVPSSNWGLTEAPLPTPGPAAAARTENCVCVSVRQRPPLRPSWAADPAACLTVEEASGSVVMHDGSAGRHKAMQFDAVFGPNSSQAEVYDR
jgi:hypothetical protein